MLSNDLVISLSKPKDFLIKVAISTVVLCLLSPIKLEWSESGIPITFQSLLVVFFPVIFGWQAGSLAVVVYLLLGAAGLPVFAGGASGVEVFMGDSAGFLFAFLPAALTAGFAASYRFKMEVLAVMVIITLSQLLILIGGLFWMEGVRRIDLNYFAQLESFAPALLIKSLMGMVLYMILRRGLKRSPQPVE